jgi:hypothetical protein
MYEVNINASPEQFLDWDKPLNQQPQGIKDIIPQLTQGKEPGTFGESGQGLYNFVGAWHGRGDVNASNALREVGIPGIRYLDQGSRFRPGDINPNVAVLDKASDGGYLLDASWRKMYPQLDKSFASPEEARGALGNAVKQQTSNYVVFNPDIVEILKKYGWAGALPFGTGAMQNQQSPAIPPFQAGM